MKSENCTSSNGKVSLITMAVLSILICFPCKKAIGADDYNNQINQKQKEAKELYSNKIIAPQDVIDPTTLPESLLMIIDRGQSTEKWYFTTLKGARTEVKPILQNEIVYQSIIDRQFAADAGFLSILSASVGNEDRMEVVAEEVLRVTGSPYLKNDVLRKSAEEAASTYAGSFPNAQFFYIEFAQLSTIKYKIFQRTEVKVKGGYSGVAFNGYAYKSDSGFSSKKFVSVNYFPIVVKGGKATATPPSGKKVLQPIPKATGAVVIPFEKFETYKGSRDFKVLTTPNQ
ncbi:MAG: hypothetical protein JJE30_10235 [Desulfuromonadales bacterium]|nr:hypothetical protein [Desulfuromonadales bacterium]